LQEVADVDRSVVTVGVFDGVHRGHRYLIDSVVRRAAELATTGVVVTFDPHPMSVLRPDRAPTMLATLNHRLELIRERGIDAVLVLPFTTELAQQPPEEFVRAVLAESLGAAEVRVGENFRFGHRAAGDVTLLGSLGMEHGFTVTAVPLAGEGTPEAPWSSSYIRRCLEAGDVQQAARALGRPHRVEGPVVHGDHRGRELGYPTANLGADDHSAIPADGVYAGWLQRASGERLPAAISVGTNPTFGGTVRRVEAYVLDRDDLELYDEHVAIDFTSRLRETVRFDSVDDLLVQMADDVAQARVLTAVGRAGPGT
jgi:riboflavin kinase/FMN adenylyltransferase